MLCVNVNLGYRWSRLPNVMMGMMRADGVSWVRRGGFGARSASFYICRWLLVRGLAADTGVFNKCEI